MVRRRKPINPKLLHSPRRFPYQLLFWLWCHNIGVIGRVDGGPPTTYVGLVIGDTVVAAAEYLSIISGGDFNLPPVALAYERRIAICSVGCELSSKVYLHARIASGTDDRGHRNK